MPSWNYLVDMYEQDQREEERLEKTLACGCVERCKCDDGDDE